MNRNADSINRTELDAYSPVRIAHLVEEIGKQKTHAKLHKLFMLGVLAGVFIAFGAMYYTLVIADSQLVLGMTKMIGGLVFSLGLILVIVAGAELFTGNNLIVMAWANKSISTQQLLKNWLIVYFANFTGAVLAALAIFYSGLLVQNEALMEITAIKIAEMKVSIPLFELFIRAILCNALVCLAVWLCMAAHDVASKVLAIVFPISAFVALGFEHSVANMYFIPLAMMHESVSISFYEFFRHISVVTMGNIVGGSIFVALIYWLVYLKE